MTAAVVAVGAVVTAGVYVASRDIVAKPRRRARRRRTSRRTRRRSSRAPPPEIDVPRRPWRRAPRAHIKRRAPVAAPAPVPVENVSSLKEETALLGAANAALARGDVKRALSLLDDYDRRPGSAVLSEERTVTGILARAPPATSMRRAPKRDTSAPAGRARRSRRVSTARAPGPTGPRAARPDPR